MSAFNIKGNSPTQPNIFNDSVFQHSFNNIPIPDFLNNSRQYVDAIKTNPILFTIMDYKAKKSSQIKPLILKTTGSSSDAKEFKKWNGKYSNWYELKQLERLRTKAFEDVDMEEITARSELFGLKKLLTKPNEMQTWADLMYACSMYKDNGWAALWGHKGLSPGKFQDLYALPTHLIEIMGGGRDSIISGYRFRHSPAKEKQFNAEDVIRVSGFSPDLDTNGSHLYGISKLKLAWSLVQGYSKAIEREYSSFDGGDLKAIITPKDGGEPIENDASGVFQKFRDSLMRSFGQKTPQKMAIVGAPIEVIQLRSDLDAAATSSAKKEAKEDASAIWGIDAQVVFPNGSGTTFDNQKEYIAKTLRNGVFPDLVSLEESLNEYLVKPQYKGYTLAFDYDVFEELTRDLGKEIEMLSKADFMSDNEKRAYIDYDGLIDARGEIPSKYWDIMIPDPLPNE
jgi:hypothetical protein